MERVIKQIREYAGLSQEQFAKALGTTAVSINRWENGKTRLNNMAQKQLYDFCRERNIPAAELLVRDYEYATGGDSLVLYHASRKGISGELAPASRSECDFGRGFYMGTTTLQPLTLVCAEKKPKFYTIAADLAGLKVLNLAIGLDWAMLIAYHRRQMERAAGSTIYERFAHLTDGYDMVVGYIANDRMYAELTNFFNGTITDVALMKCLAALELGKQYVAVTEKACRQLQILQEREITGFELSVLQDRAAERRREGVSLAEQVVRQYRREGRYFDEILEGK